MIFFNVLSCYREQLRSESKMLKREMKEVRRRRDKEARMKEKEEALANDGKGQMWDCFAVVVFGAGCVHAFKRGTW